MSIWSRFCANTFDRSSEIRPHSIHGIAEGSLRHPILLHLPPNPLRLKLQPCYGIKYSHRPIQSASETLDFCPKINLPWSVEEIQFIINACKQPYFRFPTQLKAVDGIGTPHSGFCPIQSVTVGPSWTSPIGWTTPECDKICSLIVVLPASIWVAIPIFRVASKGVLRLRTLFAQFSIVCLFRFSH